MGKTTETTTRFRVDISELKKNIQEANRQIALANSEFKEASAGMQDWAKDADGLSAKLKQLRTVTEQYEVILAELEKQYAKVVEEQGENSKGAIELQTKMNNLRAIIKNNEAQIGRYRTAMSDLGKSQEEAAESVEEFVDATEAVKRVIAQQESDLQALKRAYTTVALEQGETSEEAEKLAKQIQELSGELKASRADLSKAEQAADQFDQTMDDTAESVKEAGESVRESSGHFSGLAKTLTGGIAKGIKGIATAAVGSVTAFLAAGEASQEYVEDMGKLETAYEASGHSAETAQKSYRDMVGILGETDQSVEAVNHLAKLTKSEEELAKWTDTAAGVYATFGDSLPLEGLTEAANETAKVGQVTGPLADALNWAGESEDAFNEKLEQCNSEQERATLITETLNKLYGETGKAYQKTNGDLIAARQAQSDLNGAMAEVSKLAMPITTQFKQMGASLLKDLLPSLSQVKDGFLSLFNGDVGGADQLGTAISGMITQVLTKATEGLPAVAAVGVSMVTTLITSIVTVLPQMAATGTQIMKTILDSIIAAAPQLIPAGMQLVQFLYTSIMTGIPQLIQLGAQFLGSLGTGIRQNLPNLAGTALDAISNFASMLAENLPILVQAGADFLRNLAQGVADTIPTLLQKAPEIISQFANLINDNAPTILKAGLDMIVTLVKGIINAIPDVIAAIPKIITAIINVWEAFNWVSIGRKAITLLKDGILAMIGAVKSAGTSIVNGVTGVIQKLPGKLMQFGRNAIQNLGSAISGAASSAVSAAKNVLSRIVSAFNPSALLDVGKNLIKGLWNGISSMGGWIVGKVKDLAGNIIGGIKSKLGIKSPSRVMRDQVGKFIPEGIAVGIRQNARSAVEAMNDMAKRIMPAAEQMKENTRDKLMGLEWPEVRENGQGKQVIQNFYQYNTSPKSLSRLEIYRQTRNQLAFAKGV